MFKEYKAISLYDYAQVLKKEEEKEQTLAKEQAPTQKQNNNGIEDLKKVLYSNEK